MQIKKYLCLILSVILCFAFMCGCSSQDDKNEIDYSNIDDNAETQIQIEEPTKEMTKYVKNGFFSPTLFQSEEMITAVVEDEEIWTGEFESEKDIYFVEFADLNFDGQLEFIVTDNLYPDDFYFHANAYYLENGRLVKATVVNELDDEDGYDNNYTAYFDKERGEYVVIGEKFAKIDEYHYKSIKFELVFDGTQITIKPLLNKTTYSPDNRSDSDNIYTYYEYISGEWVEISEHDYTIKLSNLEQNDNRIEVFYGPTKDRTLYYDDYCDNHIYEKEKMLQDIISLITYDVYEPEAK